MDVHALGAPLGVWREGISGSTMPLNPTRGQWLPYRGRDMEKSLFPSLFSTLIWRSWVQTPRPPKTSHSAVPTLKKAANSAERRLNPIELMVSQPCWYHLQKTESRQLAEKNFGRWTNVFGFLEARLSFFTMVIKKICLANMKKFGWRAHGSDRNVVLKIFITDG